MKVLHLLAMNTFSGAENVACQIIHIMKKIYDVDSVYCGVEGPIRKAVEEKNIKFHGMSQFDIKEIKKAIYEEKPDVIHAHDMRASFYASLVCKDIPLICHIHNNAFDSRKVNLKSLLFLYACQKAKNILWVSPSAYDGYAFRKKIQGKSVILNNIIDIDELKEKLIKDPNVYNYDVIFLGRLAYEKNPIRLIEVFKDVVNKVPNAKLAVVGTGDLDNNVKEKVNELNLEGNVDFLGFQSNPYKILQSSKVMVMTSLWEGLPMSSLEAMALGVPIVSTPTDGLKNVVINDVTGYLSDNNEELCNDIVKIITKPELRERLSRECITESIELNDINKYAETIMALYKI